MAKNICLGQIPSSNYGQLIDVHRPPPSYFNTWNIIILFDLFSLETVG